MDNKFNNDDDDDDNNNNKCMYILEILSAHYTALNLSEIGEL